MTLWLIIFLVPIVIYLLLCLIMWRSNPYPERLPFTAVDEETFFARQSEAFKDNHEQLRALGFHAKDQYNTPWLDTLENDVILYLHPSDTLFADITVIHNHTLNTVLEYVEWIECYADGSSLTVCNATMHDIFPPDPEQQQIILLFPGKTAAELRDIHRELRQALKHGIAAGPMHDADTVAIINASIKKQSDRVIRLGWYQAECDINGWHPLTFRGALNTTWRCLPGFRTLLLRRQKRYAERMLHQARQRRI